MWSWFKFDNLGLALGMALKLYSGVIKELKLKVRKLRRLIFTFVEVTRGKLVGGGAFCPPSSPPILNRVNIDPNLMFTSSSALFEQNDSKPYFSSESRPI